MTPEKNEFRDRTLKSTGLNTETNILMTLWQHQKCKFLVFEEPTCFISNKNQGRKEA